jgi:hypothetical protein
VQCATGSASYLAGSLKVSGVGRSRGLSVAPALLIFSILLFGSLLNSSFTKSEGEPRHLTRVRKRSVPTGRFHNQLEVGGGLAADPHMDGEKGRVNLTHG